MVVEEVAKSYDGEKVCSPINHSILFEVGSLTRGRYFSRPLFIRKYNRHGDKILILTFFLCFYFILFFPGVLGSAKTGL
jgi:hypothetical protein